MADHSVNLVDEIEIRSLVHRYADASSRRNPAEVARTFASDGEWIAAAFGRHQGHDALVSFFTTMLQDWNVFIQGLLSGVVVFDRVDPDHAKGRWFVQETGQRSEGAVLSVSGVYHDEYVRDAGAWRLRRRRYDPLLVSSNGAVTALPFPTDVANIE